MDGLVNPFAPDLPNTPEAERIDSALANFIKQFFGTVTKTAGPNGTVVWTLPDPLDNPEPVPGVPRDSGEGLAAYLCRVLLNGVTAANGKNGYATALYDYSNVAQPPVNSTVSFEVDDASLFAVDGIVYIPGGGYYKTVAVSHQIAATDSVSLRNLYASNDVDHPGQLAAGAFFPGGLLKFIPAAPVGATGSTGATGATGPAGVINLDNVTIENYLDTGVTKTRVAAASIGRNHLKPLGAASGSELGVTARDGGLKFSSIPGYGAGTGGLAVDVDDSTIKLVGGKVSVPDAGITLTKLAESARNGSAFYSDDSSVSVGTYKLTGLPTVLTTLANGTRLVFMPNSTCTGASTLQLTVNGTLLSKTIKRRGVDTVAGDIKVGCVACVVWQGSYFELEFSAIVTEFESANLALPAASGALAVTQVHALPRVPKNARAVLVCLATDASYAQNDEIPLVSVVSSATPFNPVFTLHADATNINVYRSDATNANLRVIPKGGGPYTAMDSTKWAVKVYASTR